MRDVDAVPDEGSESMAEGDRAPKVVDQQEPPCRESDGSAENSTRESDRSCEDAEPLDASGSGKLAGLGQEGSAEPQPGIAESQGGGIPDAIGGGQSGQGGG